MRVFLFFLLTLTVCVSLSHSQRHRGRGAANWKKLNRSVKTANNFKRSGRQRRRRKNRNPKALKKFRAAARATQSFGGGKTLTMKITDENGKVLLDGKVQPEILSGKPTKKIDDEKLEENEDKIDKRLAKYFQKNGKTKILEKIFENIPLDKKQKEIMADIWETEDLNEEPSLEELVKLTKKIFDKISLRIDQFDEKIVTVLAQIVGLPPTIVRMVYKYVLKKSISTLSNAFSVARARNKARLEKYTNDKNVNENSMAVWSNTINQKNNLDNKMADLNAPLSQRSKKNVNKKPRSNNMSSKMGF